MTHLTVLIMSIMCLITGIFLLIALAEKDRDDDDDNGPKAA